MKHSKKFLRNLESARSKRYLDLTKNQLHILTGFLIGRCRLREYLLRISVSNTDEFRLCEEEEKTPVHLVTECIGVGQRKVCFGQETCKSGELASLKQIGSLKLEGEL